MSIFYIFILTPIALFIIFVVIALKFPPTPEQLEAVRQTQADRGVRRAENEKRRAAKQRIRNAPAKLAARKESNDNLMWGPINKELICPHCTNKGKVHTKLVTKKSGISGAKATGALLTGGVSLLATGLSSKGKMTQAFCGNCRSQWGF